MSIKKNIIFTCIKNRAPTSASKPNTECEQQFPTLGVAATNKDKPVASQSSSNGYPTNNNAPFSSVSSGRPKLSLQPRSAPLPASSSTPTKDTTKVEESESSNSPVKSLSPSGTDQPSPAAGPASSSRADSAPSWRGGGGGPTAVPSDRTSFNDNTQRPDREASSSWRDRQGQAQLPPPPSNSNTTPLRESQADSVSSWRGQPQAVPQGRTPERMMNSSSNNNIDRDAAPSSSWRETRPAAPASSNSVADSVSSWRGSGQSLPDRGSSDRSQATSGGIKFGGGGGSSSGERPKLALKPRSVKEP
jgi:hypothetical protein